MIGQVHNHKAGRVPNLVRKVAVGLNARHAQLHVVAGRAAGQQRKAQRIGAKFMHDVQWIQHVAQAFRHLAARFVAHQPVHVDILERHFAGAFQPHDNHARHPEENDVVAGFQHGGGIIVGQIFCLLWPTQRAKGPQPAAVPGVQHVGVLFQRHRFAVMRFGLHVGFTFIHGGKSVAIWPIPDGDAVSPPELTTDAPVANVFQPMEIDAVEARRHKLDLAAAHGFQRRFDQRLHFHKPLSTHQRFHNFATAFGARHAQRVWLGFDGKAGGFHVGPQLFTRFKAVQTGIWPSFVVERGVLVHDVDNGQLVTLANFIVVGIMPGRNLERARAKFAIHIRVANNGDFAV